MYLDLGVSDVVNQHRLLTKTAGNRYDSPGICDHLRWRHYSLRPAVCLQQGDTCEETAPVAAFAYPGSDLPLQPITVLGVRRPALFFEPLLRSQSR